MRAVLVLFITVVGLATIINILGHEQGRIVQDPTLIDAGLSFIATSLEAEATADMFHDVWGSVARNLGAIEGTDGHPHMTQ
jgi:hypothetical protein